MGVAAEEGWQIMVVEWRGWKINKTERHLMMTVREIGHKLTKSCARVNEHVKRYHFPRLLQRTCIRALTTLMPVACEAEDALTRPKYLQSKTLRVSAALVIMRKLA